MGDLTEVKCEPLEAVWQEEDEEDGGNDQFIKEEIYSESEEHEVGPKFRVEDICHISSSGADSEMSTNIKKKHKVRNVLPKMSPEEDKVINSMLKVDTDGTYLCNSESCKYKCKSRNGLVRHIKVMHLNLVSYNCKQCSYATKFSQSLTAHVLGVHEKVQHSCQLCDYTSTHKTTIYQHMRRAHGNEEKKKCPECDYKTFSKDRLACHINGKHLKLIISCDLCEFQTTWENCLRNHIRIKHDEEKPRSKCDECDFTSVFPYAMKTHVYFTHQAGLGMIITKSKDGHYTCEQCDYKSQKSANLRQHIVSKHVHSSFFD